MTVLQKIKADLERFKKNELLNEGHKTGLSIAIEQIEKYSEKEEQQLRDAYRAGQKRESSVIEGGLYEDPESVPDLDTYINQLKKEE